MIEKCRRSSVATVVALSRSAVATTIAAFLDNSGAGDVVAIIDIGGGDEHATVDDNRAPGSAVRISSTRSESRLRLGPEM